MKVANKTTQVRRMTREAEAARRGSGFCVEPQPIWMAVLVSACCQAAGGGRKQAIRWEWVAGRALYVNTSVGPEWIEPLGVNLKSGHTLAVHWAAGETGYSVETYRQRRLRVA
jgi:hypothetical protein